MSIQVFHGDCGGIGKSLTASRFGEYVLGKGLPLAVVETDTQNGNVGRYFDGTTGVRRIDLRVSDGWIEFLSYLEEEPANDIVVSLPAGIGSVFSANAGDLIAALADLKRTLTTWWPMNRTPDSVNLLATSLKPFEKVSGVQFVAIRNLFFGDAAKFSRWNESKIRTKFLAGGGLEMDFPELHELLVDATFGAFPAKRFSANGETGIRYGERLVLKRWLEQTTAAFDALGPKIGVGQR